MAKKTTKKKFGNTFFWTPDGTIFNLGNLKERLHANDLYIHDMDIEHDNPHHMTMIELEIGSMHDPSGELAPGDIEILKKIEKEIDAEKSPKIDKERDIGVQANENLLLFTIEGAISYVIDSEQHNIIDPSAPDAYAAFQATRTRPRKARKAGSKASSKSTTSIKRSKASSKSTTSIKRSKASSKRSMPSKKARQFSIVPDLMWHVEKKAPGYVKNFKATKKDPEITSWSELTNALSILGMSNEEIKKKFW